MTRTGYIVAALLGVAFALGIFPAEFVLPGAGQNWRPAGDTAQHIAAQRWFLSEPWSWPLLHIRALNAPEGLNLAFADGIPLFALPLKLLAPLLPPGFHGIGLWHFVCWALQPVAAVWCLRGAGEKRLLPALGVAALALGTPAWLARYGHAALSGHFLILLGLAFYLRLVRAPTRGLWFGAIILQTATLLAHPYLAVMTLALLGAVPLTLLLRGDGRWRGAAIGTVLGVVAVLLPMVALGYLGAGGEGGFGDYALNLLSPFWPYGSWLFGGLAPHFLDATGHGGWEGYNWLGLGVLGALILAAILAPRALAAAPRRHAGLALALIALTALALSFRVGFADRVLLDLGPAPAVLEQFRSSGRFFWPVGYALAIGAAVMLARIARIGPALVLALGLVQLADAQPLRAELRAWAQAREAWNIDAPALRAALARHDRLTLLPSWFCAPPDARGPAQTRLLEILLLASERPLPVNTMYLARWRSAPVCADETLAAMPLAPGELRLILPESRARDLPLVPDAATHCHAIGAITACTRGS